MYRPLNLTLIDLTRQALRLALVDPDATIRRDAAQAMRELDRRVAAAKLTQFLRRSETGRSARVG
ncbi:MAG: hypothetical protein K1X74_17215 [Pirellulales bacterium]|nr:hypothetical protein [Pirellulales bacterium]